MFFIKWGGAILIFLYIFAATALTTMVEEMRVILASVSESVYYTAIND